MDVYQPDAQMWSYAEETVGPMESILRTQLGQLRPFSNKVQVNRDRRLECSRLRLEIRHQQENIGEWLLERKRQRSLRKRKEQIRQQRLEEDVFGLTEQYLRNPKTGVEQRFIILRANPQRKRPTLSALAWDRRIELYDRICNGPFPFYGQHVAKEPPTEMLALEGLIGHTKVAAIPDTGAEVNVMSLPFSKSLGLKAVDRRPESRVLLRMGNGKTVQSLGQVSVPWRFKNEDLTSYMLSFHILADSVSDVLIGNAFLRSTETISTNRHRLSRVPRATRASYVNLLGSTNQRIVGDLHGEQIHALPDSGAEVNLLSYDYVKRRGWFIDKMAKNGNELQFADGSLSRSMGEVRVPWQFLDDQGFQNDKSRKDIIFQVLRDLPYDAVLGQDFLEDTQAYTIHKTSFLDTSAEDACTGLNLVIWKRKRRNTIGQQSTIQGANNTENLW